MPNINLSILNQKATPSFYADTLANRPAPSFVGRVFISTDTYDLYRDTGTSWDLLSPSAAAGVTGTGVSGQLALWNGTTSITGDTGLLYNATDNSLTADKFVKAGGTSAQILAADGSNITAGTGISITGGTISATATGITGSGVVNQVAFWSGTSAITGENNLWWDSVNNHLGINTNTPGTALDIHDNANTILQLNQTISTNQTRIAFQVGSVTKWRSGVINTNNQFFIEDVVGGLFPFAIDNTTGQTYIGRNSSFSGSGVLVVESELSDNHIQIVGQDAPSLRISDFSTGANQMIGIGLSTNTNNFIQGSINGNMCIFNANLTASPILFGIWNGTNTQEACRISTARNFIVGKTNDTGQKLQISGTALITGAATFSSSVTASSLVKSGGTSAQILAADGSVITAGTGITISSGLISSTATGTITGSGTSNYTARFTGTSSIGNGILQDDGFACAIGTTPSSLYQFTFAGNGNIRMTTNNYGLYFAGTGQFIDATLKGGLNNRFKFKDSGFTSGKNIITIQADSSGFSGSSLQCNNNNSDSVYKYAEFGFDAVSDVGFVDVSQNSSTNPTGLRLRTQGQNRVSIDNLFNVVIESNASQFNPVGTLYLPTISGAPSGTPTSFSNKAPMFIDSTNNRIYVYVNSAWKYSALI